MMSAVKPWLLIARMRSAASTRSRFGIERDAQMRKLLLRPRRNERVEFRARHGQKIVDARRHPQMRLAILRLKMMDVGYY